MQPYALLWLRYTAFLVLYPLGVSSELAMVWLAAPRLRAERPFSVALPNAWNFAFDYHLACWVAVAAYVPGVCVWGGGASPRAGRHTARTGTERAAPRALALQASPSSTATCSRSGGRS